MDRFSKLAAVGVALSLALAASAASANTVTAVYTGTVIGTFGDATGGAYDNTGEFGNVTSLEGLGFTATFVFDSSSHAGDGSTDQVVGGSSFGLPSVFSSATLQIAGLGTYAFASDVQSQAVVVTNGLDSVTEHLALSSGSVGDLTRTSFLEGVLYNSNLPIDLAGPFSGGHLASDGYASVGEFLIGEQNVVTLDYTHNAHGYLAVDNLTISSTDGAPEPAGWALMLLGFGGLGTMARRARRERLASAAL